MSEINSFPRQALPFSRKTKKWRKQCLDFFDSKSFTHYSLCRKSVLHKKINYDLLLGKLHMNDLQLILNPDDIKADYIPNKIQHYSILLPKLNVLQGEESKRVFDYRVIVTNPTAISEIEENKKKELNQRLQEWITDNSMSDEEASQELDKINDYFTYNWQDAREQRGNLVLNHYVKQYDMKVMFNEGFRDAKAVGEEIYQCSIEGGEPVVRRLNPLKVRILKSGYSNRIEDADIIILEDYWSPGRIIDTFHDVLKKKDIDYIENLKVGIDEDKTDEMSNVDPRYTMIPADFLDENIEVNNAEVSQEGFFSSITDGYTESLMPYDMAGNIKVLRVYWKSKRKIKKVKSYDEDGEPQYNFYSEDYVINENLGEEEETYYINQAWEGTKIGENIYVNMRPCVVQYNSLMNPSKCHFGIIGSLYNLNDNKPFSLVDMMKPYNYLYDVIHDRLNKLIARNWGTLVSFDFSKKPKNWGIDKWMYFAKTLGLYVQDSFNEGNVGAATGKLAGAMNNASNGVISASDANQIQSYVELLTFIKNEMSEVAGISPQREGQVSNRETVGGVERATLQSSHITEWLFVTHENLKKRVLEAFIETAKIAMKGNKKKFQYILPDGALKMIEIDGDEFAECDYGLVVDNSESSQKLNQQIETLAQAALQNQALSFSTIMQLFGTASLAEKINMVKKDENAKLQQLQQSQQQEAQQAQAALQQKAESEQLQREQEYKINQENNETKILVAQINAASKETPIEEPDNSMEQAKLDENKRQFDTNLNFLKEKLDKELSIKRQQIHKQVNNKQ